MPFITPREPNLKYILPVVILASILGGGVLVYQFWWFEKKEKIPETTIPKKEIPEIPADWKTYRNEEFNFEISYPSDWKVKEEENGKEGWFGKKFSLSKNEMSPKIDIIPYGLFTSGPPLDIKEEEIYFAGRKAKIMYFLTGDGEVYRQDIYDISNIPKNWIPSGWNLDKGGYIGVFWPISNLRRECGLPSIPLEKCEYEMGIRIFGEVDRTEIETVNKILSTFKFIE